MMAGAGHRGASGRFSGTGRVVTTSLAGTWDRSSAAGISVVSRSEAGAPDLIMSSRGEVMVPVSTSRRLMSSRMNAALDRDAVSARAVLAQQATAILSSRFCRSSRDRPGRSQIHTRSPTGVGRAHRISGRLPVRLVMMNSEKQVRMRCRVTRHQVAWLMRSRTGLMAAGMPVMTKTAASRQYRLVWSASSTQPKIRLPVRAVSGAHHQMARMTGQAATIPAAIAAMTVPRTRPANRARSGCHLLAATVAVRVAVMTRMT